MPIAIIHQDPSLVHVKTVILETGESVKISMNVKKRPTTVMITPHVAILQDPSHVLVTQVIVVMVKRVKILMNARKTPTTVM
jgi:aromatic ring-opening dioxygenase LigB subunit